MRSTLSLSLLSFSLLTTGCTIETVTTDIDVRAPSHAALVRTDAKGTTRLPLPADGRITLQAPAAPNLTSKSPTMIAHWCTMLSREPRGQKLVYQVVADPKCVDSPIPGSVEYALVANWSDVRIVEHHRPDREFALESFVLTTVLYGALAAAVFTAPYIMGGMAMRLALGLTTAAIGGGFDAALFPTLVAHDEDIVIHDFGPPR